MVNGVLVDRRQSMETLQELLPGIEQFLCTVLAEESLSPHAEEQRQYFLERLDIIKMPPSVPPRPQSLGIKLYPVSTTPPTDVTHLPQKHGSVSIEQEEDFAAYQRELSRALLEEQTADLPAPVEHKLYDDIDLTDDARKTTRKGGSDDDNDDESMYEIPKLQRTSSDGGYERTTDVATTISKAVSSDHISTLVPPIPPPLPPRKEQNSVNSLLEEGSHDIGVGRGLVTQDGVGRSLVTPDGVGRSLDGIGQGLVVQNGVGRSLITPDLQEGCGDSRSDRSADDILDTDEFDGMSCDSMEWTGSTPHLSIELPKSSKKKRRQQRQRPLSYSLKESKHTFHALQDVCLSGELHHRSTLSWTRRMAAITNGKLVCYKPEKLDSRPTLVILLAGYRATFQEREGRKSFEISLTHTTLESQLFLADFKEWATIWCEHINCAAEGRKALGPILHLARGAEIGERTSTLTKTRLQSSDSNLSVASSDDFDGEPGTVRVKKIDQSGVKTARMGTFAYRASQFFESLSGRKQSVKKKSGSTSSDKLRSQSMSSLCDSSSSPMTMSPVTPMSPIMPITPESEMSESERTKSMIELERHIKHQGYLDIYSSFNKRKWGKRWCMVHKNSFECYRTQTSEVCELEFLLTPCILQRAVLETKSDLGLMLLEKNREKITIEPMNWTELGSWLRVLMAETSTPATPEGLEGYMDDTNPYHEAVEIKRLSDPFPPTPTQAPTQLPSLPKRPVCNTKSDNSISRTKPDGRNRDSGNCSSESTDSRFNSLDRKPAGSRIHSSYTDTSLPRVRAHDTGDIYTQIRKPSTTNSRKNSSQNHPGAINAEIPDSANGHERKNSATDTKFVFDFEDCDNPVPYNTDGSLMDEIMSQFRSQIAADTDTVGDVHHGDIKETLHEHEELMCQNSNRNSTLNADCDFRKESNVLEEKPVSGLDDNDASQDASICHDSIHIADTVCVSTREEDKSVINTCDDTTETSSGRLTEDVNAISDNGNRHDRYSAAHIEAPVILEPDDGSTDVNGTRKLSEALSHGPSESIEELRTRLVQLKKDRIHIRDRKLQTSSQVDKDYLEAEFDRLNRECTKVMEEIGYVELIEKQTHVGSSIDGHAVTDPDSRDSCETHVCTNNMSQDSDFLRRDSNDKIKDSNDKIKDSHDKIKDSNDKIKDFHDKIKDCDADKQQKLKDGKETELILLEPNPDSDDDLEKTLTAADKDDKDAAAADDMGEKDNDSTSESNSCRNQRPDFVQDEITNEGDKLCVQDPQENVGVHGTVTQDVHGTGTQDVHGTGTQDVHGTVTQDVHGTVTQDVHGTVTQDVNKNYLTRPNEITETTIIKKDSSKDSGEFINAVSNSENDLTACKNIKDLDTDNSDQSKIERESVDISIDSDVQTEDTVKVRASNSVDIETDITKDIVIKETEITEPSDTDSEIGYSNNKVLSTCPTDDGVVGRMSEVAHEDCAADADGTTADVVPVGTADEEDDTHELIQNLAKEFETKLHLKEN